MTREEMLALIVGQRIVSVDLEGPDDSLPDALSVDSIHLENGIVLWVSEPVRVIREE